LDDLSDLYPDEWFMPEMEQIMLPSALALSEISCLSLNPIAMIKAELRKDQVTDALEGLHLALGEKSLRFRTEVRNANSQRTTNRAWDNIHKFYVEARKCRSIDKLGWCCSIYPLILNTWQHFMTFFFHPIYCAKGIQSYVTH
jgi:hypothetical protein